MMFKIISQLTYYLHGKWIDENTHHTCNILTACKYFELDLWSTFISNWISIYSNIADILIYKYLPRNRKRK